MPSDGDKQPEGVFGNLPRSRPGSRPGSRSPRRRGGDGVAPETEPVPVAEPAELEPEPEPIEASRTRPPDSSPPPPSRRSGATPPATQDQPAAGLEELAWVGVTVAAQAATTGVKLVSRVLESIRRGSERP